MPKPIPHIAGCYLIRVKARDNERRCDNGFAIQNLAITQPTALEVATLAGIAWDTNMAAVFNTSYVGESIGVYNLNDSESVLVEVPLATAGGNAGPFCVPGTVALLKHSTLIRKKHGFTRLGAVNQDTLDTPFVGTIKDSMLASYLTAWNAMRNDLCGDATTWGTDLPHQVILSYVTNKLPDVRTIDVNFTTAEKDLSSLRTRRVRG